MAVKLDIIANVKGQSGINTLQSGLNKLGLNATIASKRLKNLEVAAARSRATFAALGTTLKVGVVASLAAVTFGIGKFVKDTFSAGKLTESLQVRFKLLFGSVEEGAKAFDVMNTFAGKVPFSLEAIAAGSGNLAVISKDASELNKILEVTGNVAAATGLDFRQTAEQIQRSFAGGIASADVFRERGVRAMLGFEVGAKVSIEETKKRFFEVFANGGSFSKATKEFEKTLEAQVSFVQDAYFRFRQAAAKPLFAGVKAQLVELVGDFKKNDEQLKALAKTVGESLAKGFENLGKFIKLIIDNFDNLVKAIKIFISLKIIGFVGNLASAMLLLSANIKIATVSMYALGVAFRLNPIGIIITALQIGVVAWIAFEDQIKSAVSYITDKFMSVMNKADIAIRTFWESIGLGNDDNLKKLKELEIQVNGLASSYTKLTKEQKGLFSGVNMDKRTSRTRDFADMPNPRGDMANADKIAADKKAKDLMALNERITTMNRHWIRDQATINANQTTYGSLLKSAGIEAKDISNTISTTWIDGIRQGNSLLQNVKNTFRNILNTIAETIIKKGIELQIEKLFEFLGTKKLVVEKQITSEKAQQLALAIATAAVGGGSSFGSIFHANKGGMVPGGAPYTDRVPAMLTPGEVVIPRGQVGQQGSVTNNTINISGNVDQRAIDQIRSVISSSPSHVGGANKTFSRNTSGLSMRRK